VLKLPGTTVCLLSDHVVQFREENALQIKKHNQYTLIFDRLISVFFWSRRPFPHPLRRLHLGFSIIPINPRRITFYDILNALNAELNPICHLLLL